MLSKHLNSSPNPFSPQAPTSRDKRDLRLGKRRGETSGNRNLSKVHLSASGMFHFLRPARRSHRQTLAGGESLSRLVGRFRVSLRILTQHLKVGVMQPSFILLRNFNNIKLVTYSNDSSTLTGKG